MPYTGRLIIEKYNEANAIADIERDTAYKETDSDIPSSFFWKIMEANIASLKKTETK